MIRCTFVLTLFALLGQVNSIAADSPPVGRTSNHRDHDVLDALIGRQRFDDAKQLCQWNLDRYQPTEDAYAAWAIATARVRITAQVSLGKFEPSDVDAAVRVVRELIVRYPDHSRRWFLDQAIVHTEVVATQAQVAQTALALHDAGKVERTMKRLTRVSGELVQLAALVKGATTQIDVLRDPANEAKINDLRRLEQELRVASVSTAILQTELFSRGSDDYVSAAAKAEAIANETLLNLPASSQAALETKRMRIESILRRGDAKQAKQELRTLLNQLEKSWTPDLVALIVRVALAAGDNEAATKQIENYFDASSDSAIKSSGSVAMDLARLEWLLKNNQVNQAADWIDVIEKANGAYARRRAEAIALELAPQEAAGQSGLMITRGYELLRRGEVLEAANVLAAGSRREINPVKAARHATAAAAAFQSVGRLEEASQVLIATAEKHSSDPDSSNPAMAGVHMQGLLLNAKSNDDVSKIETSLRWHLETWPDDPTAPSIRDWLIQLLIQTDRPIDAAVASSQLSEWDSASRTRCVDLWRVVFHDLSSPNLNERSRTANRAFRENLNSDQAGSKTIISLYREVAVRFLQRRELASLPSAPGDEDPWIAAALKARENPDSSVDLSPEGVLADDLIWRWLQDGEQEPPLRTSIARRINAFSSESLSPLDEARLMLWQGQIDGAIDLLERWLSQTKDRATLAQAASMLGEFAKDSNLAATKATQWWDKLAAGSPKNSGPWHQAKLSAIKLLSQSGQASEADKRARYILLTSPAMSPSHRKAYEAWKTQNN